MGDCCVDKLMAVALKPCQFELNLYLSLHCFASVAYSLPFPNVCNAFDQEVNEPSGCKMGGSLFRLLWIYQQDQGIFSILR